MNRPSFVRTIARWLRACLPALALAVTLSTTYQPPQPSPDPDVTQSSSHKDKGGEESRVNWNS
jgi:hypothetical protein